MKFKITIKYDDRTEGYRIIARNGEIVLEHTLELIAQAIQKHVEVNIDK